MATDLRSSAAAGRAPPSRTRVALAYLAVYVIWGSTYLAIRYAIDTLPPFLMAAARFLTAGCVLYAAARLRGAARPSAAQWRATAVIGTMLLFIGNGAVVWAEQRVPTGMTALLVATAALWMVLLQWLWRGGPRPGWLVFGGLALGLSGLGLLVAPDLLSAFRAGPGVDPAGVAVLMVGAFSWAAGSIHSRAAKLPPSPALATAMEMLVAGSLFLCAGLAGGQAQRLELEAITLRSAAALLYLTVFGSIVAFTAYVWLLEVSTPARVATYAYVNPLVAVVLGWGLAGEPLSPRALIAAGIIVGGVALITSGTSGTARQPAAPTGPPPGAAPTSETTQPFPTSSAAWPQRKP